MGIQKANLQLNSAKCRFARPEMIEVEPADSPPGNPPSDSATLRERTCLPNEAGSEDIELYSTPSDDSTDDDFELVLGKKAKRRLWAAASRSTGASSTSCASTVAAPKRPHVHTVLFVPAPGLFRGVIYDVDAPIPDADLPILIKPSTDCASIKRVSRLGKSRCVKIVFQAIPAHLKVGHFRHAVRPFVPKPLQNERFCNRWSRITRHTKTFLQKCDAADDRDGVDDRMLSISKTARTTHVRILRLHRHYLYHHHLYYQQSQQAA
ncbi:hypothetical protein HPB48_000013 [Haemaphysalis longicornis]|uniref:Uncharacterized protein n=1 Tax=Haemaphysalis longicornis TaxID=44386 RepID=A0A9J6GIB4_HAELO|nr:hypothetical protein HPB48_000013 [Haemaphysalis longicornis]